MFWNDKVMFIHAPKTAGMSLTRMMTRHLSGPILATGVEDAPQLPRVRNVSQVGRHETLAEAYITAARFGRELDTFEKIFVVMRDPYTLEISRYNYLRLGHEVDRGPAQKIALESEFKEYLRVAPFFGFNPPRMDLYYHILGAVPSNMCILRFESLDADVEKHVFPYLTDQPVLGKENVTGKSKFDKYYDAESEEMCYNRHRWFFDNGYYERQSA